MIRALKRLYHRWRARGWVFGRHTDCIWILGPCDLCRHRILALGGDPDSVRPLVVGSLLPDPAEYRTLRPSGLSEEEKADWLRVLNDPDADDGGTT